MSNHLDSLFDRLSTPPDQDPTDEIVGLALGAASMCWEKIEQAGIFDTEAAGDIRARLVAKLRTAAPLLARLESLARELGRREVECEQLRLKLDALIKAQADRTPEPPLEHMIKLDAEHLRVRDLASYQIEQVAAKIVLESLSTVDRASANRRLLKFEDLSEEERRVVGNEQVLAMVRLWASSRL